MPLIIARSTSVFSNFFRLSKINLFVPTARKIMSAREEHQFSKDFLFRQVTFNLISINTAIITIIIPFFSPVIRKCFHFNKIRNQNYLTKTLVCSISAIRSRELHLYLFISWHQYQRSCHHRSCSRISSTRCSCCEATRPESSLLQ